MSIEEQRARFEAWHRDKFKTAHCSGQPTRDKHNGVYDDKYGPKDQQLMWEAWQESIGGLCIQLPRDLTADEVAEHFRLDEAGYDMAVEIARLVNGSVNVCANVLLATGIKTK